MCPLTVTSPRCHIKNMHWYKWMRIYVIWVMGMGSWMGKKISPVVTTSIGQCTVHREARHRRKGGGQVHRFVVVVQHVLYERGPHGGHQDPCGLGAWVTFVVPPPPCPGHTHLSDTPCHSAKGLVSHRHRLEYMCNKITRFIFLATLGP
jgi:hypothetical protein